MSYKEKREFEQLQQDIANLEKEKQTVTEQLNSGSLPFDQLQQLSVRISEITNLLDRNNQCCIEDYDVVPGRPEPQLEIENGFWLPILPAIGVQWEF